MSFDLKAFFGKLLFGIGLPALEKYGRQEGVKFLQKLHDSNPKLYGELLLGLYPIIDGQLEDFVKESKSSIDDDLIDDLKAIIEESAADNGINLPNLDEGTPND